MSDNFIQIQHPGTKSFLLIDLERKLINGIGDIPYKSIEVVRRKKDIDAILEMMKKEIKDKCCCEFWKHRTQEFRQYLLYENLSVYTPFVIHMQKIQYCPECRKKLFND